MTELKSYHIQQKYQFNLTDDCYNEQVTSTQLSVSVNVIPYIDEYRAN